MTNLLLKHILPVQIVMCLTGLALPAFHERPALVGTLGTLVDQIPSGSCGYPGGVLFAPVVVIGVVEENRVVAEHVEAARYPCLYLDLHAVRCKRENSLRGKLTEPELTFYYFAQGTYADSKPNPRYKHLFEAKPGSRYLFFLIRDRDVLRSVGDVGNYSIRVATGTHPGEQGVDPLDEGPDTQNLRLGRQMTEILLTPGQGAEPAVMAARLSTQACFAEDWSSRLLVAQILRALTSQLEPVRSAACDVLTQHYYGQEDCLKSLAEDEKEPEVLRKAASGLLKEQLADRTQLIESLQNPAESFYLQGAGDSPHRIREELQTMLLGTDTALHEQVCAALRLYFPHDEEPKCCEMRRSSGSRQHDFRRGTSARSVVASRPSGAVR